MLERIDLNEQEFNSLNDFDKYFVKTYNKIYDKIMNEVKLNERDSKRTKK
ncbi:MAG: hypothetical protein QT11_C0001G0979 [archaeon GW2011_AR20]|nr:MAG: hypothetical protein QT11_C0001G0979 [archaeon GW2011_AR20]MBS3161050.1 hypothetical protein [Candidatus Woesearchaeota archaeon]